MRFSIAALAIGASSALAATINSLAPGESLTAGVPFTITYDLEGLDAARITLRFGDPNDLDAGEIITNAATGTSFTWTPPTTLANRNDYTFQISTVDGADPRFSAFFPITGGVAVTPSSSPTLISESSITASTTSLSIVESASITFFTSISVTPSPISNLTTTVSPINGTTTSTFGNGTLSNTLTSLTTVDPSQTSGQTLTSTVLTSPTDDAAATGDDDSSSPSAPASEGAAVSYSATSPVALVVGILAALVF